MPVEQEDGSVQVQYQKISSDEQIERILHAIGNNLLNNHSNEGRQLLAFLAKVHEANADKPMTSSHVEVTDAAADDVEAAQNKPTIK